jgi:hypothetical protein
LACASFFVAGLIQSIASMLSRYAASRLATSFSMRAFDAGGK